MKLLTVTMPSLPLVADLAETTRRLCRPGDGPIAAVGITPSLAP